MTQIVPLPTLTDERYVRAWIEGVWGILLPSTSVCPGHVAPWDVFWRAFSNHEPIQIWKASRGFGGKSTMLATLAAAEALLAAAQSTVLGGSASQSIRVQEVVQELMLGEDSPQGLLAKDPTRYETLLTNGGWIRALMASQRSVRGPHPQKLRMDEIDEMEQTILEGALGQPMDKTVRGVEIPAHTIMSSTHQYPDGTMSAMIAQAHERGWPVYEWSIGQSMRVVTHRGQVAIEDVLLTDKVLTRSGYQQVQHVSRMGERQVVVLTTTDGRELRLTPDHKVAVPGGWEQAGRLLVGDPLVVTSALHTGTTTPPVVAGGHVRVLRGELMAPLAMGACDLCSDVGGTAHVGPVGNSFQVGRVGARSVAAQVVDLETVGDVAVPDAEGHPVGHLFTPGVGRSADLPVPVSVAAQVPEPTTVVGDRDPGEDVRLVHGDHSGLPLGPVGAPPAGLGFDGLDLGSAFTVSHVASVRTGVTMPVWDIGVEGEHEFVAEGVVVHNCYKENHISNGGFLTDRMIEAKRQLVPAHMWEAEYDLQEPSFEGRAIDTAAVDRMFDPDLGSFTGAPGKKLTMVKPNRSYTFATGVDWAKEKDWTVISTWRTDCSPWRLAAWERVNRMPWPLMVDRLQDRLLAYGGVCAHDATGIGNVIRDYLDRDRLDVKILDVVMSSRVRAALFNDYVAAVEDDAFRCPRIDFAYGEHKYATQDDLFGNSKSGHAGDSIVANAMAWYLRRQGQGGLVAPDFESLTKASHWSSLDV